MLILLWILHVGIIVYELIKKSLVVILWAMLLVVFTIPHTFHIFLQTYSQDVLREASNIAVLFMVLYTVIRFVYFFFRRSTIVDVDFEKIAKEDHTLVNAYFLIFVSCFLIIVYGVYSRGGSIFRITWAEQVYGRVPFIENLAYIVLTSISGLGFVLFARKEKIKFVIALIIYILFLITSQSRYNILGFLVPFMTFLLFNKNKKYIFYGMVSGLAIVVFVFLMQQMRYMSGFKGAVAVGFYGLLKRSLAFMAEGKGEFGLIKSFYYFIEQQNQLTDFGQGLGYMRLALLLLPTSLFPFKPRDFARDIYREWFKVDDPRGTMHPTLFGEVYANFGFFSFFMGIFYGILISIFDELVLNSKSETNKVLRISLIGTMFVLLGRGAVYNSIANCFFGLIIIFGIQLTVSMVRRFR